MYSVSPAPMETTKSGVTATHPPLALDPSKIVQSFNTWAFKREQPSDIKLLTHVVAEAVKRHEAIPFVLYWGKGPRSTIADPDIQCLDYLSTLSDRVRAVYSKGVSIKLVFTDTHARLNGHSNRDILQYFADIESAAAERGFTRCWLSELTRAAEKIVDTNPVELVPAETLERLAACAMRWFRGEGTATEGAMKYYQMNMVEKRAVEVAFPQSIFITFNGSEFRELFPSDLPVFYMYSLRRGVGAKPWFLPVEEPANGNESEAGAGLVAAG